MARLTDHVRATCPTPLDVLQIAALLETAGLNDSIARSRYAADDIFDLAQRVAELCVADPLIVAAADPPPGSRQSWQIAADDYLKGVFGVIPILLMMLVIQFLQHYGQWQPKQIIILSLSSIGSLLVTSGFVQAAARQGSNYLSQGNVRAGARFVHLVGLACLITVAASALLLAGATLATRWIGARDLPLLFVAYVTLSCLWLVAAVLGVLGETRWFGLGLAVSLGSGALAARLLVLVSASRWLVISVAGVCSLAAFSVVVGIIVRRSLRSKAGSSTLTYEHVVFAPWQQLVVGLLPYFGYGIVQIVCITASHVGAWVGRIPEGMGRLNAIAVSELGLTIALSASILTSGFAERTIRRFWLRVGIDQEQTTGHEPRLFGTQLMRFVKRERWRYVAALCLFSLAIFALTAGPLVPMLSAFGLGDFHRQTVVVVLVGGLLGYGLLAIATFDCMLLITLSQPLYALEVVGAGALASLAGTLVLARFVSYEYGAAGAVLGGLVGLLAARFRVKHVIEEADYYFFASF